MSRDTVAVPDRVKRVMAMLSRAANAGLDCPDNKVIAAAIGAKSISTAAETVKLLEVMGLIEVRRLRRARVVRITSSGATTREVAGISVWKSPEKGTVAKLVAANPNHRANVPRYCDQQLAQDAGAAASALLRDKCLDFFDRVVDRQKCSYADAVSICGMDFDAAMKMAA